MDQYLKEAQAICDVMAKIAKIEKILAKIQVIFSFIMLYLVLFKNIFTLKLLVLISMFIISIINFILTIIQRKLRDEVLELSRKSQRRNFGG